MDEAPPVEVPPGLGELRNRYFVLRHGQSDANVEKVIVSHPENGLDSWGLTDEGCETVAGSVNEAMEAGLIDASAHIHSSDFLRTKQTAEIARAVLGTEKISLEPALRERNFGTLELTSSINYGRVWLADSLSGTHRRWEVESVAAILQRTTALIRDLELRYSHEAILLVSHGDVLRVLQCAFFNVSPQIHRGLPGFSVAELRELKINA